MFLKAVITTKTGSVFGRGGRATGRDALPRSLRGGLADSWVGDVRTALCSWQLPEAPPGLQLRGECCSPPTMPFPGTCLWCPLAMWSMKAPQTSELPNWRLRPCLVALASQLSCPARFHPPLQRSIPNKHLDPELHLSLCFWRTQPETVDFVVVCGMVQRPVVLRTSVGHPSCSESWEPVASGAGVS